ncbi:MAG: hypothetical protein M3144_05425 [Actinomycetota bacterium]|nr:hypothetical protein [Actinomycetota bacterium]
MSNSEATIAVYSDPRPRRVWKIVAAIAIGLVALPVALGVGGWAAQQFGDPDVPPSAPTRVVD